MAQMSIWILILFKYEKEIQHKTPKKYIYSNSSLENFENP